jgi:hypothetical protein
VTTRKTPARRTRRRATAPRSRKIRAATPAAPARPVAESPLETFAEEPAPLAEPPEAAPGPAATSPEPSFAARVPPPAPARPFPSVRRGVFFDVENTSRAEHVARVLAHLALDRVGTSTELVAVGNWRVIGHDTARILARQGAHLVHSAPAVGVRDWSDLRIAVAAGVWLAAARPGDTIEIVTDDQAFDAVGDVATSLGVAFRRLSYRGLAGLAAPEAAVEEPAGEPRPRRRRRGGRRGRPSAREETRAPARPAPVAAPASNGAAAEGEPHTAPDSEVIAVVRQLMGGSPHRPVSIDALSNALKARGFRRPPGSLRLSTRLRRIKELSISRSGMITLAGQAEAGDAEPTEEAALAHEGGAEGPEVEGEPGEAADVEGEPGEPGRPRPRRRRRRGGRRRRGRGGSGPVAVALP